MKKGKIRLQKANRKVKWKIGFRNDFIKNELPDDLQNAIDNENKHADEIFYSDSEMCEMIMTENMLSACDTTDLKLIDLITTGNSYEEAAETCFISHNTVKYRIKNLWIFAELQAKKAFLELLKKYR